MAQPYAGSDHGMHFPLHKGTEVLLTFIDGDPDRPIIQAAVPNPETQSPAMAANQSKSIVTTSSGNQIHFEDRAGTERLLFHTPKKKAFIRIGAHNDPSIDDDPPTEEPTETPTETEEDDDRKAGFIPLGDSGPSDVYGAAGVSAAGVAAGAAAGAGGSGGDKDVPPQPTETVTVTQSADTDGDGDPTRRRR